MITVGGKIHQTIADAARIAKVSPKTFQSYIKKGIISRPPTIQSGLKKVQIFPKDYMDRALKQIADRKRQN